MIALGAIYRNAKVDAGVVQPLAYSVDRQKTIEGCKNFLSRREEMIQTEVSWMAQVGVDCVLADAPFLPCAAASAYGIPAILITNFTFDEVYRFLREGDDLDKDVLACADAALEDYKKASMLLRLPGFIDIPAFEDEILTMESESESTASTTTRATGSAGRRPFRPFLLPPGHGTPAVPVAMSSPPMSVLDDDDFDREEEQEQHHSHAIVDLMHRMVQKEKERQERGQEQQHDDDDEEASETCMGDITPSGIMTPVSMRTAMSSPSPSMSLGGLSMSAMSSPAASSTSSSLAYSSLCMTKGKLGAMTRKAMDVPLVVRMAVRSREEVLRSLGVDEETIATKKVVLVSFGGQQLTQGWGNPLPEGWIGVICGVPADHEMPAGFYRSPHGVYVPDLTEASDIVIGKLGYGTCSECIAHDKPLIFVPRPQFVEEHGLIKMMKKHGIPVGMTAEEFESGQWQRAILEADRQVQVEQERRQKAMNITMTETDETRGVVVCDSDRSTSSRRRRRTLSVSSMADVGPKGPKMARMSEDAGSDSERVEKEVAALSQQYLHVCGSESKGVWIRKKVPNNGGEVCARHVEDFLAQLDEDEWLYA